MQALRRFLLIAAGFVLFVFVMVAVNHLPTHAQVVNEDDGVRAAVVQLTSAQLEFPTVINAFVPTGSSSPVCLAAFSESPNAAFAGDTVFCGAREPAGLGKGVMLHIFSPFVLPSNVAISVTVYQKGALSYGAPVFCNVAGC